MPTDVSARWGVANDPAMWPVVVRILFVIDGRINTTKCPSSFGLGYVLETLRDPSFAWWVRFKVQVVRRDRQSLMLKCEDDPTNHWYLDDAYSPPGEHPPQFAIYNFNFTEKDFNLIVQCQIRIIIHSCDTLDIAVRGS